MAESFSEVWGSVSLSELEEYLAERADELWAGSKVSDLMQNEYERVESIRASLERVLTWLASTPPPRAVVEASQGVMPVGARSRARGRVCFKCLTQIRDSSEMMTICPVWMPGLPIHESCFRDLEKGFGGRR